MITVLRFLVDAVLTEHDEFRCQGGFDHAKDCGEQDDDDDDATGMSSLGKTAAVCCGSHCVSKHLTSSPRARMMSRICRFHYDLSERGVVLFLLSRSDD